MDARVFTIASLVSIFIHMFSHRRAAFLSILLVLTACNGANSDPEAEVEDLREQVALLAEQLSSAELEDLREQAAALEELLGSDAISTIAPSTTTTTAEIVTSTPLPTFPAELTEFTHGADTWVVVLAASEGFNDPALETVRIAAEDAGYVTGPTDCDFGAAELLGLPADRQFYTVSVYLNNEDDANAARDAFAARGVGGVVGVVQTFCLD